MKQTDKNKERDEDIFRYYLAGFTKAWIGRKFSLTRARVQQITKKIKGGQKDGRE